MPMKPAIACECGRLRKSGQVCACGAGDAARRRAFYDARRGTAAERGYDSRWRVAREAFLKAHPSCIRCGKAANVINHNPPHGGDMVRFWLKSTWESVCTPCHSGPIQREEIAARGAGSTFGEVSRGPVPGLSRNFAKSPIFPGGAR